MTALETGSNQYLGGDAALACSAETATKIDKEVVEIIRTAHEKAIGKMCIRDSPCSYR